MEGFRHVGHSGGIDEYVLEGCGLRVLAYNKAIAPVATFMVTYLVGSADEGAGLTGATHFLEHLMFKGTARFNNRQGTGVFSVLQRVGAQINATTSKDRTNYYSTLPTEHLSLAIDIEADRMRGALLDEQDLEAERTVILNEWDRAHNEPVGNLYRRVWSLAFAAHPYRHPTLGWRSDIEHVTAPSLRGFYDAYYWPDNAVASVIGEFDVAPTLAAIAGQFGGLERKSKCPVQARTREPAQRGERRMETTSPGHVSALIMAYKAPPACHEDAGALDLLAHLMSHGKSGRLWRRLTDQGLTAGASASAPHFRDPGLFCIVAILVPGRSHEEVEHAISEVVTAIQEEGVTMEEVARARNQLRAYEAYSRDGTFGIAASLNEAIAAGDWRLYTTWRERLERVMPEDVQRVARKYLVKDTRTVAWHTGRGAS